MLTQTKDYDELYTNGLEKGRIEELEVAKHMELTGERELA